MFQQSLESPRVLSSRGLITTKGRQSEDGLPNFLSGGMVCTCTVLGTAPGLIHGQKMEKGIFKMEKLKNWGSTFSLPSRSSLSNPHVG